MGTIDDHGGPLPPDDRIVAALRAGDEQTFRLLLDAWSPGLIRTARSYVVNAESAEDVVQDTWLAVLRGIDRFEARSSLRTWVYRILINRAKTRGVREHRTLPVGDLMRDDVAPTVDSARFQGPDGAYPRHWKRFPPAWPSPEADMLSREAVQALRAALADLPARQRIVITLRDVEGYGSEEVCEILEISPANQRVLLHRARATIRGRLEDYYTGSAVTEGAPR